MKVKVLKQFIDIKTKDLHRVNEELTISKERCRDINGTSLGIFVEEIKELEPEPEKEPEQKEPEQLEPEQKAPEQEPEQKEKKSAKKVGD